MYTHIIRMKLLFVLTILLPFVANATRCQNGFYLGLVPHEKQKQMQLIQRLQEAQVKTIYFTGKSADFRPEDLAFFHDHQIKVQKFTGKRFPMDQVKAYCQTFDGIQVDIEPTKSGDESYLQYLDQVRTQCPKEKNQISVAASAFAGSSELNSTLSNPEKVYTWESNYFDSVAERVDTIMAMNYDIGAKDLAAYNEWSFFQARSAKAFSARHPGGPVFQLGTPSYKNGRDRLHDIKIETYKNASNAYKRALGDDCPDNLGVTVYSEAESEMSAETWSDWKNSWGTNREKKSVTRSGKDQSPLTHLRNRAPSKSDQ